jgi:hypothetical protein
MDAASITQAREIGFHAVQLVSGSNNLLEVWGMPPPIAEQSCL